MKVRAHLNGELRGKHGKRSFPVKVGDKVKVRKGDFKGTMGKVTSVDRKSGALEVEGAEREKADGSKVRARLSPSNVELIELDLSDKRRKEALKR
jgi:large subunit ribosomal protein L24